MTSTFWRSVAAVAAGFVAVVVLSLGTDQWYPIVILVSGVPCVWLGGVLYRSGAASSAPSSVSTS